MSVLAKAFRNAIQTEGLSSALRWLNTTVPYRFTAVFAFVEGDTLRNICMVDKNDSAVTTCQDQPICDSYCIYIRQSGKSFGLGNAMADNRVESHPKRHSFHSYYGIPLFSSDGRLLGTVCHFDHAPVPVTGEVVDVLDELAPIIAEAAFA